MKEIPQMAPASSASEPSIQIRKVINLTVEYWSFVYLFIFQPFLNYFFLLFQKKIVSNPWQVESIQEFYFLKCPECTFDTKEENCFQDHALENQPLSYVLLGIESKEDIIEYNEDSLLPEDQNYCENKNNSSLSENFVIDIKEEFSVEENDPLEFCNSIANDEEEFLDKRNSTDYEGENISSCENFVEPKYFDDDQNKPCPKSSSKKDEVVPNQSMDVSKSPKSSENHQTPYKCMGMLTIRCRFLILGTKWMTQQGLKIRWLKPYVHRAFEHNDQKPYEFIWFWNIMVETHTNSGFWSS